MNQISISDLYLFYRDNLSYQALINGGGYKKYRNRILCVLLLPLIPVFALGIWTYNLTIMGSEKMINVFVFIVLYTIYLIAIQRYLRSIDRKRDKWFAAQENPEGLSFTNIVYKRRCSGLKKYLMNHDIHTPEQWRDTIQKLEQYRKKSLDELLFLMALIGSAIVMLNDDVKNIAVGHIEDERFQSLMYIIYVLAFLYPVYRLALIFRNQEAGKWPIYKQMVDILKSMQKLK